MLHIISLPCSLSSDLQDIGPVYDFLSNLYSGKNIHRCKTAMLDVETVKPGDRILFAGVGHGRDAIRAAELGAEVTVVDLSETMLRKFGEAQESEAPHLTIRRIHSDTMKVEEFGQYDMVVANFFLNVFDETMMVRVLEHLIQLGKADASVVVGDFCYPTGNVFSRMSKKLYWYMAVFTFWLFANNAFHKIYNYPEHMRRLGLKVTEKKHFKLMNMDYRENEHHFYAYQDGKAVGFIYFDPIYRNNEIISYVPNISRANADFKQGIFYTLMAHAMNAFKAEGVPHLDLGLIPLSLDATTEHQESRLLKRILHGLYNRGDFIYNFNWLELTKSRFRGNNLKTYCCHNRSIPALEFLAMFKLTQVL